MFDIAYQRLTHIQTLGNHLPANRLLCTSVHTYKRIFSRESAVHHLRAQSWTSEYQTVSHWNLVWLIYLIEGMLECFRK